MEFKKKLYYTIAIAALLYLAGCIWTGWHQIQDAFSLFRWWLIPLCLVLAFANYMIRFLKWHYYLHLLNISLTAGTSFKVFLAGLVMSATPGKFGEVFKSYLVKQINGTPISRSAPIVLAERFTDFIAFVLMSLLGITLLPNGFMVFGVSVAIILAILIVVSWKSLAEQLITFCHIIPVVGKHTEKIRMAYESVYILVSPRPLILTTLISIVSWFFECLAFYLVLWGFQAEVGLLPATFIYAFATIMGALLMTPGGIGPTEGTMGGVLVLLMNVPKGIAASATLIIRVCTLWFAVGVGLIVLWLCADTFSKLPQEDIALEMTETPNPS